MRLEVGFPGRRGTRQGHPNASVLFSLVMHNALAQVDRMAPPSALDLSRAGQVHVANS